MIGKAAAPLMGTALLLLLSAPVASALQPCPQAFGNFSSQSPPPACWRPFGPDSPFNKQLPADPQLASNSDAIMRQMTRLNYQFEGDSRGLAYMSSGRGAVYYSQPSDPLVKINCTEKWGPNTCQGVNGVDVNGMSIHIPAGAQTQDASDHHLTIIDQTDDVEYDFELAEFSADRQTLTTAAASQIEIGPDQGTGLGSQGTASHFATSAGLITEQELAAGSINHALVVSIPCTEGSVWPAIGPFGYACSQMNQSPEPGEAAPALGTLFQLDMSDAQIAATGAPLWERAIMTAMAHYGMYVNDTNGPGSPTTFEIEKEDDVSYTSQGDPPLMGNLVKSLGGTYWGPGKYWVAFGPQIDFSKLRVIDPCVDEGTCPGAVASEAGHRAAHAQKHSTAVHHHKLRHHKLRHHKLRHHKLRHHKLRHHKLRHHKVEHKHRAG